MNSTLTRAVRRAGTAASRSLGAYRHPLWIFGEGRSGTTWAETLIAGNRRYRRMFEPFHPINMPQASFLRLNAYRRPQEEDPELQSFTESVFGGRLAHRWIDKDFGAPLHRGVIVKDVFASLLAKWVLRRFPEIRPILLVRNPYAVAKSKISKPTYHWVTNAADLLDQPDLVADHLLPHRSFIADVGANGTPFQNHMLVWAITHFVLGRQFTPGEAHLLFYEDLLGAPKRELARLGERFPEYRPPAVRKPSQASLVSDEARVARQRAHPETEWRAGLSQHQLEQGAAILDRFGLRGLYADDWEPKRSWLTG